MSIISTNFEISAHNCEGKVHLQESIIIISVQVCAGHNNRNVFADFWGLAYYNRSIIIRKLYHVDLTYALPLPPIRYITMYGITPVKCTFSQYGDSKWIIASC